MIWIYIIISSLLFLEAQKEPYFKLIPATDSTSYIQWGNSAIQRKTIKTYPNWPVAERVKKIAENEDYLLLQWWTGSNSRTLLVLPLDKIHKEQEFYNQMAIDLKNEIVIYEYGSSDTVLIAENIRTSKKQYIGKNWEPCSSASPSSCIDHIELKNKILNLTWITPNKFENKTDRQQKKIKVTI